MARRPAGFTLVELLVSLAIVTVLVAALVPVVGAARGMALKVVCTGRVRDLTLAAQLYRNDKGAFPLQPGTLAEPVSRPRLPKGLTAPTAGLLPPKPSDMDPAFLNLLLPYLRQPELDERLASASDLPHVVQCPTVEDVDEEPRQAFAELTLTRPMLYTGFVYCVRPKDKSLAAAVQLLKPERVSHPRSAERTAVWADDVHWSYRDYAWSFAHAEGRAKPGPRLLTYAEPSGLVGQHVAYADGSVEWVPASQIDLDVKKNDSPDNPAASLSVFGLYFYWF